MKALKITLLLLVLFSGSALSYAYYLGAFYDVRILEKEVGPYVLIYEDFTGDYAKTGPIFTKVYTALKADGIESERGLGIYYDDPKTVAKDQLKSKVGSILEEKYYPQINEIGRKHKFMSINRTKHVTAEFPYKNSLSIMAGIFRVYPKLSQYIQEKGYKMAPMKELYDLKGGKIVYMMEITE